MLKLNDHLGSYHQVAENALRNVFSEKDFPLYRLMKYQMGWIDELGNEEYLNPDFSRLHASLVLMACEAVGGDLRSAAPAAVSVELLNQFVQVHTDIQEGSQDRYGRSTLWWVYGPAQAINVGDGLHAMARMSLMQYPRCFDTDEKTLRALAILDNASLRTLEGLHQELVYQERVDISTEAYLKMSKEKIGALIGCALELGALSGGSSEDECEIFRKIGEELGVALQVQEDLQMIWGDPLSGKRRGSDLLNKKKGYPIIYTLEEAALSVKREIGTMFFKRVLDADDLDQLVGILDDLEVRKSVKSKIDDLCDSAIHQLSKVAKGDLLPLESLFSWIALRGE